MKLKRNLVLLFFLLYFSLSLVAVAEDYRDYDAVSTQLREWQGEHSALLELVSMGKSAGGRDIWMMRVAASGDIAPEKRQAMFIGGNIEGVRLLATEAAMATIEFLVANREREDIRELLRTRTYYIAPVLNPDVMQRVFAKPLSDAVEDLKPVNDDLDLATDEDGPDDLNGDGLITMMRYKDPDGEFIENPDDPRFMKKADTFKGEQGIYKIITEGIDNDNDGKINEDPPGGVVINQNFPHDFQYFEKNVGPWPASEPESIALLKFMVDHQNIGLVYTFGSENNLLNLQRGKQAARPGADKYKVPERMANFLGLDPEREYSLKELVDIFKGSRFGSRMEINEDSVMRFLGQGPTMSITNNDFKYFEEISKNYKSYVKDQQLDTTDRKFTPPLGDGSFVTWAYYHYGVPFFTVDLWGVPKPKKKENAEEKDALSLEKLKKMSSDEFLALGEEKIGAFLKAQGAPPNMSAERLMNMVRQGMATPERMATMMESRAGTAQASQKQEGKAEQSYILDWAQENLPEGGFVPWTKFDHPTLGEVEIGGMKPLIDANPPYEQGKSLLEPNAEFAIKLAGMLPRIELADVNVTMLDQNVYEITAYVVNKGFFPTAMRQGVTAGSVYPIIVKLEIDRSRLLSGQLMERISSIEGNGRSMKMRWLVGADKGTSITLTATSEKSGSDSAQIVLK